MARPARQTGFNGEQFKRARQEKRLSQTELARLLGVHRSTVVRWETGQMEPSPEQIDDIAEVLSTPHSWFIEEASEAIPFDDPLWLMDPDLKLFPLADLQRNTASALLSLGRPAREIARMSHLSRPRIEELMVGKRPTAREIQRLRDAFGRDFNPIPPPAQQTTGGTLQQRIPLALPVSAPGQYTEDEKLEVILQRLTRIEQRLVLLEQHLVALRQAPQFPEHGSDPEPSSSRRR